MCCLVGVFEFCKFLLGCTPLHWAAIRGNLVACEELVRAGKREDLMMTDCFGLTPLQLAYDMNHSEVASFLVYVPCPPLVSLFFFFFLFNTCYFFYKEPLCTFPVPVFTQQVKSLISDPFCFCQWFDENVFNSEKCHFWQYDY